MSRIIFLLKLVLLVAAYAAVVAGAIARPRSFASMPAHAVNFAQYSVAFFLLPNAFSFFICAIFLRHRWGRLNSPQILAAGFTTALATVALTFAINELLAPLINGSGSIAKWSSRAILLLPGIFAAQLLWFGKARDFGHRTV